jgi:peptidoglycan/xylan/chitin deacetylase (PgdA/CDA1 family)
VDFFVKKYLVIISALMLVLAITACAGDETPNSVFDEAAALLIEEPSPTPEPPEVTDIQAETGVHVEILPASTSPPMVALTFDDGPSSHTDSILDTLEQYGGRATFFVIGNRVAAHRTTIERAVKLGNEIANHTHTHPRLTAQSDADVINEIQSASAAIAAIKGFSPPIYRPPFGATDERIINISAELGYGIVKWTLDPLDWRDRDADIIYDRIMSKVEDGSVIVLHDIHLTTAQSMNRVIPSLVERGFQFVTVSELLNYRYGGLESGSIFGSYCAWRIWDNEAVVD